MNVLGPTAHRLARRTIAVSNFHLHQQLTYLCRHPAECRVQVQGLELKRTHAGLSKSFLLHVVAGAITADSSASVNTQATLVRSSSIYTNRVCTMSSRFRAFAAAPSEMRNLQPPHEVVARSVLLVQHVGGTLNGTPRSRGTNLSLMNSIASACGHTLWSEKSVGSADYPSYLQLCMAAHGIVLH